MSDINPLVDGPDVSWIPHCHPGDDQGHHGACSVFALASWAECMLNIPISDAKCIDVWRRERMRRDGDLDGGLSIPEAFFGAAQAGITPPGASVRRVSDLSTLPLAPLVGTFRTTRGWYEPNNAGCIDHIADESIGRHAVLIVAAGRVRSETPVIWIENSWSSTWGYQGFGCMSQDYFTTRCDGIWQITVPDRPSTIAEANAEHAAKLAETLREPVVSIARNLHKLGYTLPADGSLIMADIVRRSMAGDLTDAQEKAKSNLADVYLMLRGQGVTDADINTVATHLLS